ncbi:ABC transporter permease [Paenibacillus sp. N1-5-1-14]|uniref:oligopeptide ABC transporter permease n=1 Tax=Paenibacillus radicibacter TaxID=2972488 RepID=UPI0021594EC5|nr:oligopeptide ABC transporter permease [Paenibacillus radicibacter]MCR8641144.1 ABC transporter permease [Paenibacillus radicibacter]
MSNTTRELIGQKKVAPVPEKRTSLWRQAMRDVMKNKLTMTGLVIVIVMFVACFIGPLFSPYADNKINPAMMNVGPNSKHWLGTDLLGRDVLTRLLQAGRISLTVGIASMILSVFIGTFIGIVSGYYRGIVDQIFMRIADLLMTIPSLPIMFIIGALMSDWKVPTDYRMYMVMIMLSVIGWPGIARMVRSQMLSLREREYMQAATVLGLRDRRKLFNHLLPNVVPLLIVISTLSIGGAVLSESVLSFFGLGVMPPTPTWGNMIDAANSIVDFEKHPWLWIPPGVAIFLTVIAFNIFGDGLRDVLDPKQKK